MLGAGGYSMDPRVDEQMELELYKSLRAECAGYIEKIPALWWQKFLLVGATVAFVVSNYKEIKPLTGDLGSWASPAGVVASALSIIPVLAILVDARILEYGLHARAISAFIEQHFVTSDVVRDWERTLWRADDWRSPVVVRSMISVLITVVPTMGLMLLTSLIISVVISWPPFVVFGVVAAVAYVPATVVVAILIWRKAANPR